MNAPIKLSDLKNLTKEQQKEFIKKLFKNVPEIRERMMK
jgi:hypothetical protein